jgi:hypothetical protein
MIGELKRSQMEKFLLLNRWEILYSVGDWAANTCRRRVDVRGKFFIYGKTLVIRSYYLYLSPRHVMPQNPLWRVENRHEHELEADRTAASRGYPVGWEETGWIAEPHPYI